MYMYAGIMYTCACWKRLSISPMIHSKASVDSLCSSAILRAHNVERRRMLKRRVAFFWASRERWSVPLTITSLLLSSCTSLEERERGERRGWRREGEGRKEKEKGRQGREVREEGEDEDGEIEEGGEGGVRSKGGVRF